MDAASVDHPDAAYAPIDGMLQSLSDRTPRLVPVEPVEVHLFVHRDLASSQPSQMSAVDPRSDPLEPFRLVPQDFEGLAHEGRSPAIM
jgi:hypothetical protein